MPKPLSAGGAISGGSGNFISWGLFRGSRSLGEISLVALSCPGPLPLFLFLLPGCGELTSCCFFFFSHNKLPPYRTRNMGPSCHGWQSPKLCVEINPASLSCFLGNFCDINKKV